MKSRPYPKPIDTIEFIPDISPSPTAQQMRFLSDAARDLNSTLDSEEVFRSIARRVGQLVECHFMCVMLFNEKSQNLEHSYTLKFGEVIQQEGSFPLGYGISGQVNAQVSVTMYRDFHP